MRHVRPHRPAPSRHLGPWVALHFATPGAPAVAARAWVGMALEAAPGGVRILRVAGPGPAAQAGQQAGELVTSFDAGELVTSFDAGGLIEAARFRP